MRYTASNICQNQGVVMPVVGDVRLSTVYGWPDTRTGTFEGSSPVIIPGVPLGNSPAKILKEYLVQNDIEDMTDPADGLAWPLYVGYMPDGSKVKTDVASVYDTPGIKDGREMSGEVAEFYGIQIKVRSRDYVEGFKKIQSLAASTEQIFRAPVTVDGDNYLLQNVSRQGPVIPLGVEKGTGGRRLFTINLLLTIAKTE
jgi:hypothetical protein